MKRIRLVLFTAMLAWTTTSVYAAQHLKLDDRIAAFETAVDDAISEIVPGPMLQYSKAAYLEGYGLVLTMEVALVRPSNPFSASTSDTQTRLASEQRHESLKERAAELLSEQVAKLDGLTPDEKVSLVINVLNTNPAIVKDLPAQLVITATKQDAVDFSSGAISESDFNARVTIREY